MKWPAVWQGTATGLLSALVGAALLAGSLYLTDFAQRYSTFFVSAIALVCVAAAGFVAGRQAQTAGWLHGATAGLGVVALGSIIGFLMFGGGVPVGFVLSRLVLAALVGAVAGITGVNA